jgi:pimeloyl-ACP methyl ester carboxylesterase
MPLPPVNLNKARPLIYSTALPPAVVVGISKALELVQEEIWRRERLAAGTKLFRSSLCAACFKLIDGNHLLFRSLSGIMKRPFNSVPVLKRKALRRWQFALRLYRTALLEFVIPYRQELLEQLPHAELVTLEGCGHMSFLEREAFMAESIRRWWNGKQK